MAFVKHSSPLIEPVRPYLEGVAKNLVDRIWGPNGPPWGTKLSELEDVVISLRQVVSEKMLHLALQRQAEETTPRPQEFQECPSCAGVIEEQDPEPRIVDTRGGEAQWQEPHRYCSRCRRAFFPSVPKSRD